MQSYFFQGVFHYGFCRGINVNSKLFKVEQVHRVTAFDYVKRIILVKYGKVEIALYSFSHVFQNFKIKLALLFDKLYCNVAVSSNISIGQIFCFVKFMVVVKYTIMSKRKFFVRMTIEWVVVLIEFLISLSGQTGVSHNCRCSFGNVEANFMSRFRTFENCNPVVLDVRDARSISATFLRSVCECLSKFLQDFVWDNMLVVKPAK